MDIHSQVAILYRWDNLPSSRKGYINGWIGSLLDWYTTVLNHLQLLYLFWMWVYSMEVSNTQRNCRLRGLWTNQDTMWTLETVIISKLSHQFSTAKTNSSYRIFQMLRNGCSDLATHFCTNEREPLILRNNVEITSETPRNPHIDIMTEA